MANPKIEPVWNHGVDEVLGDAKQGVTGVRLKSTVDDSTHERTAAGVFLAIGHTPNTAFLGGQLELTAKKYIKWTVPFRTNTSVEGVFAAGDVADDYYKQAVTAAGSGCMAALDAERWLRARWTSRLEYVESRRFSGCLSANVVRTTSIAATGIADSNTFGPEASPSIKSTLMACRRASWALAPSRMKSISTGRTLKTTRCSPSIAPVRGSRTGTIASTSQRSSLPPTKRDLKFRGRGRLSLARDDEFLPDGDDADEYELDPDINEFETESLRGRPLAALAQIAQRLAQPKRAARQAIPPSGAWRKSLNQLRIAQGEVLHERHNLRVLKKNSDGQLWYGLDIGSSQTAGLPYIALRQRSRKKDGTLGQLSGARLVALGDSTLGVARRSRASRAAVGQ